MLESCHIRAGAVVQLGGYLPSIPEHPGLTSSITKAEADVVAHTCHPITQEVKAGRSEIPGHSQIRGEFQTSLGYVRQIGCSVAKRACDYAFWFELNP